MTDTEHEIAGNGVQPDVAEAQGWMDDVTEAGELIELMVNIALIRGKAWPRLGEAARADVLRRIERALAG